MELTIFVITIAAAYLLGAIPFAVLIARIFRLADPRTTGSGNPGATNIARSGHKPATVLTFLADFGKGLAPVLWFGGEDAALAAMLGVAAVVGHVFSVFLRFKGGKGVATTLGVVLAWYWPAAVAAAVCWLLVFARWRISAVASIVAMAAVVPVLALRAEMWPALAGGALALLVMVRHRRNVAALWGNRKNGFAKRAAGETSRPIRMLLAMVTLLFMVLAVSGLHDYSQTRYQLELIRHGNTIAVERPWIVMFYFFNEAGSGLKFLLTGNDKHMRSFPTDSYLYQKQLLRAHDNDWLAQVRVAHRYHNGAGVEQSDNISLYWLRQAVQNAPFRKRMEILVLIERIEAEKRAADNI